MLGSLKTQQLVLLPLVALWCLSPTVLGNLGQEIAQTSEEEVADTIATIFDADDYVYEIELPEFDEVPDAVNIASAIGTPLAATPPAPPPDGPTFADSLLGQALNPPLPPGADPVERAAQFIIAFWHQLVLDLQLADYSRVDSTGNEDRVIDPENPGPCYASRAMAMAHLAMYDAYVGVTEDAATYLSYSPSELPSTVPEDIRPIAAAAAAGSTAALVLTQLYENPEDREAIEESRQSFEDNIFSQFGEGIPFINDTDPWPMIVADSVIADRRNDGAGNPDDLAFVPDTGSNETLEHTPDPTAVDPESGEEQFLYAPHWGDVKPFLHSFSRLPTLPRNFPQQGPLNNYLEDFQEVFSVGRNLSDQGPDPERTREQTRTGLFWAYDGGFRIGVPPRLYNSITDDILIDVLNEGNNNIATGFQLVRLYAMVNVALADAGISAWEDKYHFNFWRPIIGIRRANEVPETVGLQDETWAQLGAPNTNRDRPGINPAFPAYPSGHATFGTSVLEVVKLALGLPDQRKFEMRSDEFNGMSVDDGYCARFNDCVIDANNPITPEKRNKRPNLTRMLTIDEAIEENKQSRIYLGVHWQGDQIAGDLLGQRIAQNVISNFPRIFT